MNPATGATVGHTASTSPTSIDDLATCQYPPSLQVQTNIDSREAPGDQFTLSVTGGGLTVGNTATTTGNANGTQPEMAGPLPAIGGTNYTFTESAANGTTNISSYVITPSCVDTANGNASLTLTNVSSTSFDLTLPAVFGAIGQAVVCTFTTQSKPTITSGVSGNAEVGAPYSETPTVSAGLGPYQWAISPAPVTNLSLNTSTGTLSGTPTTSGTFSYTLQVTDANGLSLTEAETRSLPPTLRR